MKIHTVIEEPRGGHVHAVASYYSEKRALRRMEQDENYHVIYTKIVDKPSKLILAELPDSKAEEEGTENLCHCTKCESKRAGHHVKGVDDFYTSSPIVGGEIYKSPERGANG